MLEWLYVGDYGKENNIKANFLGLNKEINGVKHQEVDLSQKLVVTISIQKGCPMNCMFCDCPKVPFKGNATRFDLEYQVEKAIISSMCTHTKRFNLHLARMGEPCFSYAYRRFSFADVPDYTFLFDSPFRYKTKELAEKAGKEFTELFRIALCGSEVHCNTISLSESF